MDGFALRLLAAAVLAICSSFMGRAMANAQLRRAKLLTDWLDALSQMKDKVAGQRLSIRDAMSSIGFEPVQKIAAEMESPRVTAEEAWLAVRARLTARGQLMDCMDDQDLELLTHFFSKLGASGLAAQLELFESTAGTLKRLQEGARKKWEEQGKLYSTLGALAGLAIAMIML